MTKKCSFEKLLEIDSSISFQDRNLRTLAIEMYKIYHVSPTIMNKIFTLRHQKQYNLRNWTYFDVPKVRTVIMVLRVLDISVLGFGKFYQHV